MTRLYSFSAGKAELVLAPELGGAIAKLNVNKKPILRPWVKKRNAPFSLASNILIPFSNRISEGGFTWRGTHHSLTPNMDDEPFPIHGDAFQKPWEMDSTNKKIKMFLRNGAFGPWRYKAEQTFNFYATKLTITLTVTNQSERSLPFGCGFHPWFPRSANTTLSFSAKTVWLENEIHLPTDELDLNNALNWRFDKPRPLPVDFINNGYTQWGGVARVRQGKEAVSCTITGSKSLNTAIVYSPNELSGFFCFEPVSHPVNAFHLPGNPGLKELEYGEKMTASMNISWEHEI